VNAKQSVDDEFHLRHLVEAEQLPRVGRQFEDAQENPRADAVGIT